MEWAEKADRRAKSGDAEGAKDAYVMAMSREERAAEPAESAEPSRSILYRSAASLALCAGLPSMAANLAALGLQGAPPDEVRAELDAVRARALATLRPTSPE